MKTFNFYRKIGKYRLFSEKKNSYVSTSILAAFSSVEALFTEKSNAAEDELPLALPLARLSRVPPEPLTEAGPGVDESVLPGHHGRKSCCPREKIELK